jgi:NAD(P)-dependent dehydrogenase (short-subunit alcohol dehydrogenase family)
MSFDIDGKIVLITGANRGIGRVFVDSFIRHGAARVYAAVRRLNSAAPLVEAYGDKVVPIQIDLTAPRSITEAAKVAQDVEVVVNNAGVLKSATPLDPEAIDSLEFEMQVNVYGLMRMAQAFAPVLKANGGGAFVQLNSVASLKSFADISTYCASKAAAYSITQALREVLDAQGTTVVSVHPGPIATDMATAAGMGEVAEPPARVAEALLEALRTGDFHVFPDSMAQQVGSLYQSFAESVIEAPLAEVG